MSLTPQRTSGGHGRRRAGPRADGHTPSLRLRTSQPRPGAPCQGGPPPAQPWPRGGACYPAPAGRDARVFIATLFKETFALTCWELPQAVTFVPSQFAFALLVGEHFYTFTERREREKPSSLALSCQPLPASVWAGTRGNNP